jgi:hypothetical protein
VTGCGLNVRPAAVAPERGSVRSRPWSIQPLYRPNGRVRAARLAGPLARSTGQPEGVPIAFAPSGDGSS